jgi:hypothetical protein
MKTETGGPAFPVAVKYCIGHDFDGRPIYSEDSYTGATLRDYFAAKAMQTLIACVFERSGDANHIIDNDGRVSLHFRAYEHADLMIKARSE